MTIPSRYKHQDESFKFFSNVERGYDASDPGTGKTRVQIDLFTLRRGKKKLVIAPKSLLWAAWADDIKKFAPQLRVSVCPADKREKSFQAEADVYITNTDAVNWLVKRPAGFFRDFDTLVIDESSAFKHHTSARSRALNKIKKYFRYRYAMSGTPDTNSVTELWHQFYVLDDGKALGTSFYQFRNAVCDSKQVGPDPKMLKWTDKPNASLAVSGLIRHMVMRHKLEECIDMPENVTHQVAYHMSSAQLEAYRDMESLQIASLNTGTASAVNAAAVMTKLLQIASGAVYGEGLSYHDVDVGRYELVADLIEQRAHTVCFFLWQHQKVNLIKEFDKRGITWCLIDGSVSDKDRQEAVRLYQGGFYRVLLAHPASAAHGLTLTKGTTTIWASPTYNLEHFMQGNRRIYRAGQNQRTETIVILAPGTIEEKVAAKLEDKNARQGEMLDLLKS